MTALIARITKIAYAHVVKPIAFRQKPDDVHARLIGLAGSVQKVPIVRSLPKLWRYRNDAYLKQSFFGYDFSNPVGLSAGFDTELETPRVMKSVGFGWMTGGSVTWGKYEGNERPWFYRLPKSKAIVVNKGLASEGTTHVAKRLSRYEPSLFADFPLNISVAKTNSRESVGDEAGVRDYCLSLAAFDVLEQVKMLEINISCPNTFGGEPFTTPERFELLLSQVDELHLTKPVVVKMPITISDETFDRLIDITLRHQIAAVSIGNLLKDRTKVKLLDPLPDSVKGNLGGALNREIATRLIARAYKKTHGRLTIIGIGGIMSAEDAYEKIRAGASLVALVTGVIFEGPQLVGDINRGLVRLLRRDGLSNISEAIGLNTKKEGKQ